MSKKPLLPAPTDSWIGEHSELAPTELATNISRHTDRTSYSIPDDGSPITLPTKKLHTGKTSTSPASLLIEYFEIPGDQPGRPSVRVKVSPSGRKDQTFPSDRKPSYTRRVSLTSSTARLHGKVQEFSRSVQTSSELSTADGTFHHNYIQPTSDISTMPADSMIDTPATFKEPDPKPTAVNDPPSPGKSGHADMDTLKAPARSRSRSLSKERITQKVLEKLAREQSPVEETQIRKARKRRPTSSGADGAAEDSKSRSRKSSRSNREDDYGSVTESSLLHARDRDSSISGISKSSLNPRLLQTVEDVVRRLILPEIETIKRQQSVREGRQHRDSSGTESSYARIGVDRQLSQSTSIPSMKPKVVLNRDGDDPGLTLTGDSVRHRKHRRSSKETYTSKGRSRAESVDSIAEEKERRRRTKEVTAAGVVGGALTAAALKSHDSHSTVDSLERDRRERRKRRSKSHTRSVSAIKADTDEVELRRDAPRLPMASEVVDSELTRESILSAETAETGTTTSSRRQEGNTRLREVARGSARDHAELASLGPALTSRSVEQDQRSPVATRSRQDLSAMRSDRSISSKARKAALIAAGFGAGSSALYGHDKEYLLDQRQSTKGSAQPSDAELNSTHLRASGDATAAGSNNLLSGRQRDGRDVPINQSRNVAIDVPSQPGVKDRASSSVFSHADSLAGQREFASSPPYDQEYSRHQLRGVGADTNATIISAPQPVESHVASLLDPSDLSSGSLLSERQPESAGNGGLGDQNTAARVADLHESTSAERWAALRGHAQQRSIDVTGSRDLGTSTLTPTVDIAGFHHKAQGKTSDDKAGERPVGDPDQTTVDSTERREESILEGPLGDEHEHRGQWPYEPTPPGQRTRSAFSSNGDLDEPYLTNMGNVPRGAAAGLGIDDTITPHIVSTLEGQIVQSQPSEPSMKARSLTIDSPLSFSKAPPQLFDDSQAHRMNRVSRQANSKHARHLSRDSYGVNSQLYDSATGRGMTNIQSQDVMALMDHLTVRDGHRNARDTEILVTLVRSAAEMRNSFEDMKKFVEAQNQINISQGDAAADRSLSKVLNAANRIPHSLSPQAMRSSTATDQSHGKRKNLFQRALSGLSSKNTTDLSRMEEMLMQLLDEVEALRTAQKPDAAPARGRSSLDSFEKLRSVPEPSYGPNTQGAASSSHQRSSDHNADSRPHQPRPRDTANYDFEAPGRASSPVGSNGEDTYDNGHNYNEDDGMRTPTQEANRQQRNVNVVQSNAEHPDFSSSPAMKDSTARHKSTGSSLFGIPKISRWSKTTTSSMPVTPNYRSQRFSEQSRWESETAGYMDETSFSPVNEDRLRSPQSLAREEQQELERSSSPLLPDSELSLDEAKYQANRHSLTLQHPQPRQGPNQNQRSLMETQASAYRGMSPDGPQPVSPTSDAFGSVPSLGRFNRFNASQDYRPSTLSPLSSGQRSVEHARKADEPLVPNRGAEAAPYTRVLYAQEEAYSSDAHSEDFDDDGDGQWIEPVPLPRKQSPYSPGGLLAPIEERYSLEHTRSSISATPAQDRQSLLDDRSETPQQAPRRAIGGPESPTSRKITGPRDMPTRPRVSSRG